MTWRHELDSMQEPIIDSIPLDRKGDFLVEAGSFKWAGLEIPFREEWRRISQRDDEVSAHTDANRIEVTIGTRRIVVEDERPFGPFRASRLDFEGGAWRQTGTMTRAGVAALDACGLRSREPQSDLSGPADSGSRPTRGATPQGRAPAATYTDGRINIYRGPAMHSVHQSRGCATRLRTWRPGRTPRCSRASIALALTWWSSSTANYDVAGLSLDRSLMRKTTTVSGRRLRRRRWR